jgi:hypothetical protein
LPKKFFMALVKNHARERAKMRPSRPTWNSQSLRCQMSVLGVPLETVGPGTKIKETTATITAGTPMARMKSRQIGTSSCAMYGKL